MNPAAPDRPRSYRYRCADASAKGGRQLAETVALIESEGGSGQFIACDMGDVAAIRRLVEKVGEVDILVNNAGICPLALTLDQDVDLFKLMFDVNIRGPYFLTAALAARMIAKGSGCIINVTSASASTGVATASVYSATKAALDSFTRTWAVEFGSGVRVNSVAPGLIHTDARVQAQPEEDLEAQAARTPLSRTAAPEEVAEIILFLASPRSSYITAATIAVDGGYTAT